MTTKTITPHQRITGKDRQKLQAEMLGKYRRGVAIRALAAEYGGSYGLIHRLLSEAGAEFRPRGGKRDRSTKKAQRAKHDELA